MKRILSLCLTLCMLISAVALFASCSGKGSKVKVSNKVVEVDLKDYEVFYEDTLNEKVRDRVTILTGALGEYANVATRAQPVRDEVDLEGPAILIGDTGYEESNKVMKKLGDYGWSVSVVKDKIVIAGTNDFLTRVALSYFTENYINQASFSGSVLSLNKKVEQKGIGTMEIVDGNGEGQFTMVYNSWTDNHDNGGRDNYNYGADENPTTGGPDIDYTYTVVNEIRASLKDLSTAKERHFLDKKDTSDIENEYEILVGNMQRADYREELNKLTANQYGIVVKNHKVMLLAWNDVSLAYAHELFQTMLKAYTHENEEGKEVAVLPTDVAIVETMKTGFEINFPKPEGLYLHGTVDVGDHSIEYIYTGDGVTEANYLAYCDKLEQNGYSLIDGNSKPLGTENIFRYYWNEETGSTLYVYYSPYQYAEEQKVKDTLASIRVVSSNTQYVTLPDASILNPNRTWTKVTDTMVTSLTHDYSVGSWGLAYIITLEDGSFIVFDGGIGTGTTKLDNNDRIWNVLNSLYKEVFKTEPQPGQIHIRAWLITHEHADHMNVFRAFLKEYGEKIRFDYLLFNATSESECVNSTNPESKVRQEMATLQSSVSGGFDYLKVHTGQKFYFANCEIDIMGCHEDTYPKKFEYFNNSTTTFKTILTSTDNAGQKTTTDCIWLGDLERIGSRRLRAMWGENMKADQVQIAHHGYNGVEEELYDLIEAELVWWPSSGGHYAGSYSQANSTNWYSRVNHHVAHEMTCVKMIIMHDGYDYTLTFTTAGPQYDNIVDVNDWEKKDPDGRNLIDKRQTPTT